MIKVASGRVEEMQDLLPSPTRSNAVISLNFPRKRKKKLFCLSKDYDQKHIKNFCPILLPPIESFSSSAEVFNYIKTAARGSVRRAYGDNGESVSSAPSSYQVFSSAQHNESMFRSIAPNPLAFLLAPG